MLTGYDFTIEYRESKNNNNADALSRLPMPETADVVINPSEVMLISNSDDSRLLLLKLLKIGQYKIE